MYVELNDWISKASIRDEIPEGTVELIVAKEFAPHLSFTAGLRDNKSTSKEQRLAVREAVHQGLFFLNQEMKVCFVCAAGWSRSVTMACLVAALWEKTSFEYQYRKVAAKDPRDFLSPSPVRALVKEMYPELFEAQLVEV